METSNKSRLQ